MEQAGQKGLEGPLHSFKEKDLLLISSKKVLHQF